MGDENWNAGLARDDGPIEPVDLRTDQPHPARVYDFLLGGKDNYPADRAAAELGMSRSPEVRDIALANRAFLRRAVTDVARSGVRQFLDLGTGIPTSPNVHEVAQSVYSGARVVYVDNDPIVSAHARALLASAGTTNLVQADLRDIDAILDHPGTQRLIDFREPVAVMMVAILHHIPDESDPRGIAQRLMERAAPGSHLVVAHLGADLAPEKAKGVSAAAAQQGITLLPRDRSVIESFFDGLEMLDPGLVRLPLWRPNGPDDPEAGDVAKVWSYGGVARKP
ncbi:SAM-dependent methyltransferase [Actinomadura barringtoniae]|uniref:SAM-dependent methyltransferase n=1 Tax=Actinomadura barringtoniae TaxID=1427535 RepID=A0A939PMM3_9ACTN|nr:SAM-dependent methyltransferase [Actinomadura barringtoniae]MBO2452853.1 SAM-dependent methyltransferase [Actinomadura barringtoniae]